MYTHTHTLHKSDMIAQSNNNTLTCESMYHYRGREEKGKGEGGRKEYQKSFL